MLLRSETFAAEVSAGYLSASAREHVYNVPGDGTKISQLNWDINHAAVVGARLSYRPLDWLTLRARGWTSVAADSAMNDYDWFLGYQGPDSWTHWSTHPSTTLVKAMQGDLSAAVSLWGDDAFGLSAIAGYRYMTMKWDARGGSYLYSTAALRDTPGTFPDQTGIAYQQWWQTPYIGLGATMSVDELSVTGEVIGGFTSRSRDKDYHALRAILFEEKFSPSAMWGASLGVEYRLSRLLSATGRVEYQRYFEAEGGTRLTDGATGATLRFPKPAAGADSETLLVSLGVKARL